MVRHRKLMRSAMAVAKEVGTIISLDGGAQRYDEDMKPITEASHIVIVARDYAEKYTGTTNLKEACRIIHERGACIAGVTDGAMVVILFGLMEHFIDVNHLLNLP